VSNVQILFNTSQSWDKIILFFSQDEHKALEQFFELFDEFCKHNPNETTPVVAKTVYSTTNQVN
jgi:hypothetical protein